MARIEHAEPATPDTGTDQMGSRSVIAVTTTQIRSTGIPGSQLMWTDPALLDTPGADWAKIDGRRDPDLARAFYTTDTDLDERSAYVLTGWLDAPHHETGKQVVA